MSDIETRLRLARTSKGMTQKDVAEKIGLKPAAIGHYEAARRRPCLKNLKSLCIALDVSSDYLIGLKK